MGKHGQFTTFQAQDGKTDELADILIQAADAMADVDGCRLYTVGKDPEQDCVHVFEAWDSKAAHDNALNDSGATELIAKARPLLDGAPETTELDVIGGIEGIKVD